MKRGHGKAAPATNVDWNDVSISARKEAANAIYVPRAFTDEIVSAMQELREGSKAGAEAMCLVVIGEKGVGKSAFLKRYAEANPPQRIVDRNVVTITRPVVYVSFPPSPTLKGAAEVFLEALAGPASLRGSRTVLTQRIKASLISFGTELVIADEFQHVRDERRKGRSEVADWLKDIVKSTGIPFTLAGMPETVSIIEADAQLLSLTERPIVLAPYCWDDLGSRHGWKALLAKMDIQLPFNIRSNLADDEVARALYIATGGNLRRLRAILRIAVNRALMVGDRFVTFDDLAAGYSRLPPMPSVSKNPFSHRVCA